MRLSEEYEMEFLGLGVVCIGLSIFVLAMKNDRLFYMLSIGKRRKYDPDNRVMQLYVTLMRGLLVLLMLVGIYTVISFFFP